jgi:hypothetical protein
MGSEIIIVKISRKYIFGKCSVSEKKIEFLNHHLIQQFLKFVLATLQVSQYISAS